MFSGAAVCATSGTAAHSRQRMVSVMFFFMRHLQTVTAVCDDRRYIVTLKIAGGHKRPPPQFSDKQLVDVGQRNKRRTSQRSGLLVFIRAARRCIGDLLAVIDPQYRVDCRSNVILHGLLFILPTDIDGFPALRLTDNPARLHAAANEYIGISGTPVVTAEVQVHVWSAPELMDYSNQGLIQHGLSCFLARHLRKIFDEAAERCIQSGSAVIDGHQKASRSQRAAAVDLIVVIVPTGVTVVGIGDPHKSRTGIAGEYIPCEQQPKAELAGALVFVDAITLPFFVGHVEHFLEPWIRQNLVSVLVVCTVLVGFPAKGVTTA